MSYRTAPRTGTRYALLSFDGDGLERADDPDGVNGRFSDRVVEDLAADAGVTDVFVLCHGWKGDLPSAIDQYDRWIGAMDALDADREAMAAHRPSFKPYRIGVHWPSLPWGDEELGPAAFAIGGPSLVDTYVQRLGDRPGLRDAVSQVVETAERQPVAIELPPEAEAAYRSINGLMPELGGEGPAASPAADRSPFDPRAYFDADAEVASFGLSAGGLGGILAPLRQLSFWKMKQRALSVGEGGAHALLVGLQESCRGRDVRFHLMGHSFGCIVASAMACGPDVDDGAVRTVSSLVLVQGALSLWSYADEIPAVPGRSGHFRRLLGERRVSGPVVTTRSVHDTAVGQFYPLGAGVAGQVSFGAGAPLPLFGGLGTFGAQAITPAGVDVAMLPASVSYGFAAMSPGSVVNLDASRFISKGGGASGAHNDIDGPEVAHAVWQAALASRP